MMMKKKRRKEGRDIWSQRLDSLLEEMELVLEFGVRQKERRNKCGVI